jgi:hypothetical protein
MAQALSQPGGVPAPSLAPSPIPPTPSRGDELPTNNLNSYVRAKLSKGEVINYSDCARALGTFQLAWSDQPAPVISQIEFKLSVEQCLLDTVLVFK